MTKTSENVVKRRKRHWRVRAKVRGTAERPRLSVFRSNKNICAQLIDDEQGVTLVSASSLNKDVRGQIESKTAGNIDSASVVGKTLAERAKAKGLSKVCFDRGGYKYHGRVKALADAAREAGLEF